MKIVKYEGVPTIAPGATLALTVDEKIEKELIELETGERLWANNSAYDRTEDGFKYSFTNCFQEIPAGHLKVGTQLKEIE